METQLGSNPTTGIPRRTMGAMIATLCSAAARAASSAPSDSMGRPQHRRPSARPTAWPAASRTRTAARPISGSNQVTNVSWKENDGRRVSRRCLRAPGEPAIERLRGECRQRTPSIDAEDRLEEDAQDRPSGPPSSPEAPAGARILRRRGCGRTALTASISDRPSPSPESAVSGLRSRLRRPGCRPDRPGCTAGSRRNGRFRRRRAPWTRDRLRRAGPVRIGRAAPSAPGP